VDQEVLDQNVQEENLDPMIIVHHVPVVHNQKILVTDVVQMFQKVQEALVDPEDQGVPGDQVKSQKDIDVQHVVL
jgi:hypothetical protein